MNNKCFISPRGQDNPVYLWMFTQGHSAFCLLETAFCLLETSHFFDTGCGHGDRSFCLLETRRFLTLGVNTEIITRFTTRNALLENL